MSDKFCCVTWRELSLELASAKEHELSILISEKGLPRSVFASVYKVLEGIANYCPNCGSALNSNLIPKLKEQHTTAIENVKKDLNQAPVSNVKRICKPCGGRKILGYDSKGTPINCMACHGEGLVESKHVAEDPRAKFAQSKVDDIREKKGIGDNPINVEDKE